jgi:hypothetical protein
MAVPAFAAGAKLRASDLNSFVLLTGFCTADTTYTSTTTLANVTGMSVALEASAAYIFDGYVAYNAASTTPDFKMAFTIPTGATGHWMLHSLSSASSNPGNLNAAHSTSFTTAQTGGTDASFGIAALPAGYMETTDAGTVQVQAAQNTSNGTTLTVFQGSWIRFQRVA